VHAIGEALAHGVGGLALEAVDRDKPIGSAAHVGGEALGEGARGALAVGIVGRPADDRAQGVADLVAQGGGRQHHAIARCAPDRARERGDRLVELRDSLALPCRGEPVVAFALFRRDRRRDGPQQHHSRTVARAKRPG
jgi:hypothetical protein